MSKIKQRTSRVSEYERLSMLKAERLSNFVSYRLSLDHPMFDEYMDKKRDNRWITKKFKRQLTDEVWRVRNTNFYLTASYLKTGIFLNTDADFEVFNMDVVFYVQDEKVNLGRLTGVDRFIDIECILDEEFDYSMYFEYEDGNKSDEDGNRSDEDIVGQVDENILVEDNVGEKSISFPAWGEDEESELYSLSGALSEEESEYEYEYEYED